MQEGIPARPSRKTTRSEVRDLDLKARRGGGKRGGGEGLGGDEGMGRGERGEGEG